MVLKVKNALDKWLAFLARNDLLLTYNLSQRIIRRLASQKSDQRTPRNELYPSGKRN